IWVSMPLMKARTLRPVSRSTGSQNSRTVAYWKNMRVSRRRSCSPILTRLRSAGVSVFSSTTLMTSPVQVARAVVGPRPNCSLNIRTISFASAVRTDGRKSSSPRLIGSADTISLRAGNAVRRRPGTRGDSLEDGGGERPPDPFRVPRPSSCCPEAPPWSGGPAETVRRYSGRRHGIAQDVAALPRRRHVAYAETVGRRLHYEHGSTRQGAGARDETARTSRPRRAGPARTAVEGDHRSL